MKALNRSLLAPLLGAMFRDTATHREVVQAMCAQLNATADKFGLARQLMMVKTLKAGQISLFDLPHPQGMRLATSPTKYMEQEILDKTLLPPEFIIETRPMAEKRAVGTPYAASELESFWESMVEGTLVAEDRLFWSLMKMQAPALVYKRGQAAQAIKNLMNRVPTGAILIASDVYSDCIADQDFITKWEPAVKHEDIEQGRLGAYDGKYLVFTDAYRHPTHRILEQGQMAVMVPRDYTGQMTQRECGYDMELLTGAVSGTPTVGAWVYGVTSMVLTEGAGVWAQLDQEQ